MNNYDRRYEIRLARYHEIEDIMLFIKENWKENHILANNRDYFEYEYVDGKDVHFMIAREKSDNRLVGIIGYIPASRNKEFLDIWTVMWKVKEKVMPLLGMELLKRTKEVVCARASLGVGDNPNTTIRLLNKLTDYETGKMKHFYRLSDSLEFKIAEIKNPIYSKEFRKDVSISVIKYETAKELEVNFNVADYKEVVPYKDIWYINHRYFEHPVYSYDVYGLRNDNRVKAILITREQQCNGSKALRIVDYIGEQAMFAGLRDYFREQLLEYEYIDFYVLGFDYQYIKDAGFIERNDEDTNIIPNYFYPYEKSNIDIWCSGSANGSCYVKGDADQDRPNKL